MSNICKLGGDTCDVSEVGPFMQGISKACGNVGDCTLTDIMTVVANVGNFILGLVGAVVFLMFVIGGFKFITAGGNMDRVKQGKTYIVTSVVGLLIVFGAFAAIQTLKAVLTGSTATPSGTVVDCTGREDGDVCGLNMECKGGICMTGCEVLDTGNEGYGCYDMADPNYAGRLNACFAGACPGGDTIQCCTIE